MHAADGTNKEIYHEEHKEHEEQEKDGEAVAKALTNQCAFGAKQMPLLLFLRVLCVLRG